MSDRIARHPRIVPEGLYSAQDIIANLGIGPSTLCRWTRKRTNPLKGYRPGTKQQFFIGADILEFIRRNGDTKGGGA